MTLRSLVVAAALAVALAPSAAAQEPPPAQPPPAPPPPAPVAAALTVKLEAPYREGGRAVALRGGKVRVTGTVRPFVAGQRVVVRLKRGKRKLLASGAAVRQDGETGRFAVRLPLRRTGDLRIVAVHRATPEMAAARSRSARLLVSRPRAVSGQRGAVVRLLQRSLRRLRYLRSASGVYDAATARAVMAWRKVNRAPRAYTASGRVLRRILAGRGGWRVRHPRAGRHVEADISLQALALVDGRRVHRVLHTSSGAPATPTVIGSFRFYSKTPGTNSLGMVHSAYFIRGYAIHGYASVPPYNASHGCLRIPIPDALSVFRWIRLGDRIVVER